jgi:hypothetical protein
VDPDVMTSIIKLINTEARVKVHDYLGMTIDFSKDGKAMIITKDYINRNFKDAPDDMLGESAAPAANHLFG